MQIRTAISVQKSLGEQLVQQLRTSMVRISSISPMQPLIILLHLQKHPEPPCPECSLVMKSWLLWLCEDRKPPDVKWGMKWHKSWASFFSKPFLLLRWPSVCSNLWANYEAMSWHLTKGEYFWNNLQMFQDRQSLQAAGQLPACVGTALQLATALFISEACRREVSWTRAASQPETLKLQVHKLGWGKKKVSLFFPLSVNWNFACPCIRNVENKPQQYH